MSESKPTLRREQIAGMNIHYIMWSLDYFLDVQQRLGFESIELWCAEPHVTLDHTGYFEAEVLAKKAADRGLRYRTLCPENVVYPWQYCARKPLHEQRSLAYFKHGIELAEVLGVRPYVHQLGLGRLGRGPRGSLEAQPRALVHSGGVCRRARSGAYDGKPASRGEQPRDDGFRCEAHD